MPLVSLTHMSRLFYPKRSSLCFLNNILDWHFQSLVQRFSLGERGIVCRVNHDVEWVNVADQSLLLVFIERTIARLDSEGSHWRNRVGSATA